MKYLYSFLFVIGVTSLTTWAVTYNYTSVERVKICEYAKKQLQFDIALSQKNSGLEDVSEIECAGKGHILRDDRNRLQSFTFFTKKDRYSITVHDSPNGKVTNVTFIPKQ